MLYTHYKLPKIQTTFSNMHTIHTRYQKNNFQIHCNTLHKREKQFIFLYFVVSDAGTDFGDQSHPRHRRFWAAAAAFVGQAVIGGLVGYAATTLGCKWFGWGCPSKYSRFVYY